MGVFKMKSILVMLFAIFAIQVLSLESSAQQTVGVPVPAVSQTTIVEPAPAVVAPAPVAVVPVAAPAAPPAWIQSLLTVVSNLPIIGPYASKAMLYVGMLSLVLTSLVAFLLGLMSTLSAAFGSIPALQSISAWIEEFKDGQFMYWLKYFSNFNAQKPSDPPPPVQS